MNKLMNGYVVSAMLIIYGVFFILLENRNRNSKFPIERVTQISFQTAAVIGCFLVLALIPGTSRSGATILGSHADRAVPGRRCGILIFLGIPVMFGASLLKIIKFLLKAEHSKGMRCFTCFWAWRLLLPCRYILLNS